jgi:NADH-quinone oxidoreductase subunit L
MNLFVFSMLLLVLAGDLILMFVGWEGVGLVSYLLIGYFYTRPAAAHAATKAFVMNRIGDVGFLLGLLLALTVFGTANITEINSRAFSEFTVGSPILLAFTLLLFIGAIGKSAQLPLYTWLPDAMEGPTPVSALIHAATMVTAGVYLVVRLHPVYEMAPATLYTIGIIGGVTSLFAAVCATAQTDLKRVLAFSTVSQLGLMFLACGAGAFYSAMFHLTTHAFVKATLFLSAGIVVHMMNGSTNMERMGGLSKFLTKTHWFFLIGALSLAGIPPLAAFFSKDLILEQEYLAGYKTLFYVALAASVLTGFYLMRAYFLTFTGETRVEPKILKHAHEASPVMWVPVSILALLSIIGGFLGCTFCRHPLLSSFLEDIGFSQAERELSHGFALTPDALMAIFGAFLGVGVAWYIYTFKKDKIGSTWEIVKRTFYIDEIYWALFGKPLETLSKFFLNFTEPKVFDGMVRTSAAGTKGVSLALQRMQSGEIRSYVAWMVLGTVFLLVYLVIEG